MSYRAKRPWSPIELEYLESNKDKESLITLSRMLGRAVSTVKTQIALLEGRDSRSTKQGIKSSHSYIGKRRDLSDIFFRSSYEANSARYFNYKGWEWEYEPKVFFFQEIKRGNVSYLPDFQIKRKKGRGHQERWIEVKGYMDKASRTKLRRFKKYYPEEFANLIVICRGPNTEAYRFCERLGVGEIILYKDILSLGDKIPHLEI